VWPTSAVAGTYDDAVAAAIATHARPTALQRNHEYAIAVGGFVQMPAVALSVAPTDAVPLTNGLPMFASADAAAIGPMRPASATVEPEASFAVTTSPSALPTSAGVSGYVRRVAPATGVQLFPAASQRSHRYA